MKHNTFAADLISSIKPSTDYKFNYIVGSTDDKNYGLELFYEENNKSIERVFTNPDTFCKDLGEFLIEISKLK